MNSAIDGSPAGVDVEAGVANDGSGDDESGWGSWGCVDTGGVDSAGTGTDGSVSSMLNTLYLAKANPLVTPQPLGWVW